MQQPHHASETVQRVAAARGARSGAASPPRAPGRLGAALAAEASRYLDTIELFRREGCRIAWAPERSE